MKILEDRYIFLFLSSFSTQFMVCTLFSCFLLAFIYDDQNLLQTANRINRVANQFIMLNSLKAFPSLCAMFLAMREPAQWMLTSIQQNKGNYPTASPQNLGRLVPLSKRLRRMDSNEGGV